MAKKPLLGMTEVTQAPDQFAIPPKYDPAYAPVVPEPPKPFNPWDHPTELQAALYWYQRPQAPKPAAITPVMLFIVSTADTALAASSGQLISQF